MTRTTTSLDRPRARTYLPQFLVHVTRGYATTTQRTVSVSVNPGPCAGVAELVRAGKNDVAQGVHADAALAFVVVVVAVAMERLVSSKTQFLALALVGERLRRRRRRDVTAREKQTP